MAMIFTLSSFSREWLREKAHIEAPPDELALALAKARREEAEEARREAERAAGTPVTEESYNAWWERFSAETAVAEVAQCVARCALRCCAVCALIHLALHSYFAHACTPLTRHCVRARRVDKGKRLTGRRFFETRGEAAAASEDEAEGELPLEEEEDEEDEEEEETDDEDWDPDALGCVL
jgi:hypothetical protein